MFRCAGTEVKEGRLSLSLSSFFAKSYAAWFASLFEHLVRISLSDFFYLCV